MTKNLELFELFIINLPKFRKIHIVDILTQSQLTVTRFFPSFSWKERQKLATNAKVAIKMNNLYRVILLFVYILSSKRIGRILKVFTFLIGFILKLTHFQR